MLIQTTLVLCCNGCTKLGDHFRWLSDKLTSNVIACCIHFGKDILSGDSCFAERTEENIGDAYLFHAILNGIIPTRLIPTFQPRLRLFKSQAFKR
jgi:hypothetical protein